MRLLVGALLILIWTFSADAADRFKYSELQIKDYDEIQAMVRDRLKKAQKILRANDKDSDDEVDDAASPDQEAVEQLRSALHLILSRPNQDNMLAKIMPDVRKELMSVNAFEDSLSSLTTEAIDGVNNDKLPIVFRSTYLIVLENILSEFKPRLRDEEEIRKVFEKIRDAKVKLPKEVAQDLKLRSMVKTESPSDRAKRFLDGAFPPEKKKK